MTSYLNVFFACQHDSSKIQGIGHFYKGGGGQFSLHFLCRRPPIYVTAACSGFCHAIFAHAPFFMVLTITMVYLYLPCNDKSFPV